ncbi:hypothetical protein [Bosea sp. 2KB_26]|uniref:hypothetical protein n=1 Tax=Bosea sp. 2KB_26 TaxID=3237475 RepID=UPI003F8FB285
MASQGMTSAEIAAVIGEISPQRVRAIARRFCITLARSGSRRFGLFVAERRAKIIIELAEDAGVSPATMIDRITRVVLDDGIDHARRKLGKLALPTGTRT